MFTFVKNFFVDKKKKEVTAQIDKVSDGIQGFYCMVLNSYATILKDAINAMEVEDLEVFEALSKTPEFKAVVEIVKAKGPGIKDNFVKGIHDTKSVHGQIFEDVMELGEMFKGDPKDDDPEKVIYDIVRENQKKIDELIAAKKERETGL